MTHEFKDILEFYKKAISKGLSCVIATIVELEGSSYRKPGVRMLFCEDGTQIGAISGGCVEKDVWHHSLNVFKSNNPKTISYDGRYRLGCEGKIYILIEPINLKIKHVNDILNFLNERSEFKIISYYNKKNTEELNQGSEILYNRSSNKFNSKLKTLKKGLIFNDVLFPVIRLIIIGTEHDASPLCKISSNLGWEVTIVGSPNNSKTKIDFPEAKVVENIDSENFNKLKIDNYTSAVLMSHNYAYDFKNFLELSKFPLFYLGIIGTKKRKNMLINSSIEYNYELSEDFLNSIYSPAGVNIKSITPHEIAISIISEIILISKNKLYKKK